MIKYFIVEANTSNELSRLVNKELCSNNCKLVGGVSVISSQWSTRYSQAMTEQAFTIKPHFDPILEDEHYGEM
jgi:hypothetical protein